MWPPPPWRSAFGGWEFSPDQEMPPIPHVWPVIIGTYLICVEILKLENADSILD